MKNRYIQIFSLVFLSYTVSSYKLAPQTFDGFFGNNVIYDTTTLSTFDFTFIQIMGGIVNEMNPAFYAFGAPSISYGGRTPSTNKVVAIGDNGFNEIDMKPFSTAIGGVTFKYGGLSSRTEHTEFDISINKNPPGSWGDATFNNRKTDRASTVRHEIGHAMGLGHSATSRSLLMYDEVIVGQVKLLDTDAKDGYRCIFENTCLGNNEQRITININGDIDLSSKQNSKVVEWKIENEPDNIIGFNILAKSGDCGFYSINDVLISHEYKKADYSFFNNSDATEIYLEIVKENLLKNEILRIN